jgi:hypothetical protein
MTRRLRLGAQDGYTLAAVMLVLLATSIMAGATFAAVGGDLPYTRAAQDRKQAYAAAEAGVEYYLYQLTRDNDFWKTCASAPGPNGQPNPVNQVNPGPPRRWRNVAGVTDSRFSIELLPANGAPSCDTTKPEATLIDQSTGTFRIRSTGHSRGVRRSIVTTMRRDSFLDYLYFTDYESADPLSFDDYNDQVYARDNCVKYRAERELNSWCRDNASITFPDWDAIRGPLHTNDSLLVCGTPEFGRDGKNDRIGIVQETPNGLGWVDRGGCSGNPTFKGPVRNPTKSLNVPTSNTRLKDAALAGYLFYGTTRIVLKSNGKMDVTTHDAAGNNVVHTDYATPSNGVVYVEKQGTCALAAPAEIGYTTDAGCAVLTLRGTYSKSMTFGARDDILIDGNLTRPGTADVVLGLIAERFVRVKHEIQSVSNCNKDDVNVNPLTDVTVEAAILALKDSFVVDNWRCGAKLGTLTVKGAIAQSHRGAVGTFSGSSKVTGYTKDYNYDDRLRYRSPPYFLDPISAAWRVVRNNEQVPAAD